jgi:segregation and condensation protein B
VERKRVIEALVFASEDPLTVFRLQTILGSQDRREILQDLAELRAEFAAMGRSFHLVEVAGGYQFRTTPEMAPWVRKLKRQGGGRMSQASMETLAIVAYKQPVTRAEVEYVRGVDCGAVIRGLLEKGLLKIMGRKDVPGRPLLYGTSRRFLEVFNLKDLSSLPDVRDMAELGEPDPPEDVAGKPGAESNDVGDAVS